MEIGSVKIPNLVIRLMSTLVLVPLALGMIWNGGWPYSVFVVLGGLLVLYEWSGITKTSNLNLVLSSLLLVVSGVLCAADYVVLSGALVVVVSAFIILRSLINQDSTGVWAGLGALYVTLPVVALIMLRSDVEAGLFAVAFVMIVVWVTDSAAYGAGRAIGGVKLWPAVSPNKTWAGLLGGTLAAACAGAVIALLIPGSSPQYLAFLGAVLAIVSQGGDLVESAIKRHFNVKDSGFIFPGHGGIFDRVDGLMSASVFAATVGLWLGGTARAATGLLFLY